MNNSPPVQDNREAGTVSYEWDRSFDPKVLRILQLNVHRRTDHIESVVDDALRMADIILLQEVAFLPQNIPRYHLAVDLVLPCGGDSEERTARYVRGWGQK